MTDTNTQEKAIEALIILTAALTNIRLYPTTSDMITNSIDSAYTVLNDIIKEEGSVVFAESEGNLLISGEVLNETDKKRPQVISFIKLMLSLSIKSISFEKGMDKSEILSFLEVVSRKPDDLEKEGGILKLTASKGIKHILLDKKLFVAMDKNQRIVDAKEGAPSPDDERRSGVDRRANDSLEYLSKGGPERRKEEQRNQQLQRIQNGINSMIKGDDKAFMDVEVMRTLPSTFLQLLSQKKDKVVGMILDALGRGILNKDKDIRGQVSIVLANISIKLITDRRIDDMINVSHKLTEWIRFETLLTPAYKHICNQLQSFTRSLLMNYRLNESHKIMEPFRLISSGKIKKPGEIKDLALEFQKGLASDDIMQLLLGELQTDSKNLREEAVKVLAMLGEVSAETLLDVLQKLPESESPRTLKEKILFQEKICTTLGLTGSREAIPALNAIIERKDPLNTDIYNKEVQAAAKNALEIITKGPVDKDIEDIAPETETTPLEEEAKTESEKITPGDNELAQQLNLVDQHVEKDGVDSAVKLLFDMIVKSVEKHDFGNAESLRDKLLEIAPMALTEIVESGEIIEKAKSGAIDQDHLNTWNNLYDRLTETETNALFFAMNSTTFDENKTVLRQNESNTRLYFINKGNIKLVSEQDGKEILIKDLGPGDIMGQESFFSLTVCTASAITLSKVELNFLEKDILWKLEKETPAIESKLHDFCLKFENVSDLLKKQGRSRRSYNRIDVTGKIAMQTVDASGSNVDGPIQGTLADISMGGLSFYVKIPKEKADKMFLEPAVKIKCVLKAGSTQHTITQKGKIVGVLSHLYDYSVHIKFDKLMEEKTIREIEKFSESKEDELDILTDP